jgi:hypothetical protein
MVKFALLNELSLPFSSALNIEKHFNDFLKLLKELKSKELEKLRIDRNLKELEILPKIFFQQFLGQLKDKELKDNLRAFIANSTIIIETPFIKDEEKESTELLGNEYFYKNISNNGALACGDIWNSLVISFNSSEEWNKDFIHLEKETIDNVDRKKIVVKHISYIRHLASHRDFFDELENFIRMDIKPSNFWDKRNDLFKNKIVLCESINKQINNIDFKIFSQALSILRDLDSELKTLDDFTISGESESVKNDFSLKKLRIFTILEEDFYFENHIKNLSNGYRIHYFGKDDKIYIGYIGKHLPTKNFN